MTQRKILIVLSIPTLSLTQACLEANPSYLQNSNTGPAPYRLDATTDPPRPTRKDQGAAIDRGPEDLATRPVGGDGNGHDTMPDVAGPPDLGANDGAEGGDAVAADGSQPGCPPGWEDCNGDPVDGCEIPVGQPNSCDRLGLSTFDDAAGAAPGCGTPYCGEGKGNNVQSFGSWHCLFCAHCQLFDDGGAWCLGEPGTFSPGRCEDCCDPSDGQFPQICEP